MKKRRRPNAKKGQQPIRTPVKRHRGTPGLPIYHITVRGDLPSDLLARVSVIHARSILQSDSGSSSESAHSGDPDGKAAIDPGVV